MARWDMGHDTQSFTSGDNMTFDQARTVVEAIGPS